MALFMLTLFTYEKREFSLKYISIAIITCLFAFSVASSAEEVAVEGEIGVYSQYIWRGKQESPNTLMVGEAEVELGKGLAASFEVATPLDNNPQGGSITELDVGLAYTINFSDLSIQLGYLQNAFINHSAANTGEVLLGVAYEPVSITYYYAVTSGADGWKKDGYIDAEVSDVVQDIDLTANFGFYLPSTDAAAPTKFPTTKNELGHVNLTASKAFEAGDLTLTPSIMLSIPTYTGKPHNTNQVVLGLAAGF